MRLAGQSQTGVRDAIANKSSIWYHIGLSDTPTRIEIAGQAYEYIKNYEGNIAAMEDTTYDTVGPYPRMTKILVKNNIAIIKYNEYSDVGHSASVPFLDPAVLQWLFQQSLKKRLTRYF